MRINSFYFNTKRIVNTSQNIIYNERLFILLTIYYYKQIKYDLIFLNFLPILFDILAEEL